MPRITDRDTEKDFDLAGWMSGAWCLSCDGSAASMQHGQYWVPNAVLDGGFAYEAWIMPGALTGPVYWLSEGTGGAHAILAGMQPNSGLTRNIVTGNTNYTPSTGYGSNDADGFAPGEWGHMLVAGLNASTQILVYLNGILVFAGSMTLPRQCSSSGNPGTFYVGGSSHQNWLGRIAAIRGFEGFGSQAFLNDFGANQSWVPDRSFASVSDYFGSLPPNIVLDYTVPHGGGVPDTGIGYNGKLHPGRRVIWFNGATPAPSLGYVFDPTCPLGGTTANWYSYVPAEYIPARPAVPNGAKIFDSFSRANQTFAFQQKPTLGSTEGGSLGSLTWNHNLAGGKFWGIFCNRCVGPLYTNGQSALNVAYVTNNSGDMDVQLSRRYDSSNGTGTHLGIAFRLQDTSNFWYVLTGDQFQGTPATKLSLFKMVAGSSTYVATYTFGNTFTTGRVVTSGTSISVYADNGSGGWTLGGTTTDATFQTATGVGIYNTGELTRRDGNFTVF